MITPDIISYIKTERAKNTPDSVIKTNMLANGWNDSDITKAMSEYINSSSILQPPIVNTSLKEQKKKIMWITFFVLIGIDFLIILGFKFFNGTWGIFGISPLSIIIRILVIYFISSFATRTSSSQENTSKTVGKTILKVISTILLTILIGAGIFFVGCLFLFSGF